MDIAMLRHGKVGKEYNDEQQRRDRTVAEGMSIAAQQHILSQLLV